jgi:excisionase family DNA binding protein
MMYLTGEAAAMLLGVSRRTLYRWHHQGRLPAWQWTPEQIEAKRAQLQPRKRGPRRSPASKRYHEGRHSFERGLK